MDSRRGFLKLTFINVIWLTGCWGHRGRYRRGGCRRGRGY